MLCEHSCHRSHACHLSAFAAAASLGVAGTEKLSLAVPPEPLPGGVQAPRDDEDHVHSATGISWGRRAPMLHGLLAVQQQRENRRALPEFAASRREKESNRPPLCNQVQGYGVQQASSRQKFRGLGPAGRHTAPVGASGKHQGCTAWSPRGAGSCSDVPLSHGAAAPQEECRKGCTLQVTGDGPTNIRCETQLKLCSWWPSNRAPSRLYVTRAKCRVWGWKGFLWSKENFLVAYGSQTASSGKPQSSHTPKEAIRMEPSHQEAL